MKCLLNINGSFKKLFPVLIILLFFSCNTNKSASIEEGQEIIYENMNNFISNLYGLPYKKSVPIIVLKKVGEKNFITENCESIINIEGFSLIDDCKKGYFELINNEGFDINENSKYLSFDIEKVPNNFAKVELGTKSNIKYKEYVELSFSNLYIDIKKGKAFIIIQEVDVTEGRTGGKADIYFFEKFNDKWKFVKKQRLVTA